MPPTLIETPGGERLVLLPESEYRRLVVAAEGGRAEPVRVPAEFANRIFHGEHPIAVYRSWRKLTGRELAERSRISGGHLSDIENGRRSPSREVAARIAAVLGVSEEDLVPANPD